MEGLTSAGGSALAVLGLIVIAEVAVSNLSLWRSLAAQRQSLAGLAVAPTYWNNWISTGLEYRMT